MNDKINPNLILPTGTQIVSLIETKVVGSGVPRPKGITGTITESPIDATHAYRVRLADSAEISLKRNEFSIRKSLSKEYLEETNSLTDYDLYEFIIYRCIVGSRAYGLDHDGSDTDIRGIYLPSADLHWSLYKVPEQIENKDNEECYWELQKFLVLASKANPNILECLFTPLVKDVKPIAQELLDMRHDFLSKLVYQTYSGYAMSQFKKMEQDLRSKGAIKWKHAMHLIRLLLAGIDILKTGDLKTHVSNSNKDRLLLIRNGEYEWERLDQWRLQLHKEFEETFSTTKLPERPNIEKINDYLINARRSMT